VFAWPHHQCQLSIEGDHLKIKCSISTPSLIHHITHLHLANQFLASFLSASYSLNLDHRYMSLHSGQASILDSSAGHTFELDSIHFRSRSLLIYLSRLDHFNLRARFGVIAHLDLHSHCSRLLCIRLSR